MKTLELLVPVKHNGTEYAPGDVIEIEDKDANRLVLNKSAQVYKTPSSGSASEEEYEEVEVDLIEELSRIDGVNEDLAERLVEAGYESIQEVAEADPEELILIKGIGKKSVEGIQDSAEDIFDSENE